MLVALSCGPSRHNKRRQSLAIIAWLRIVRKSQPSRFGNGAPREPRRCVEGGDIPSYQSRESVAGASSFALDHDACGITIKGVRSDTVLAKQVFSDLVSRGLWQSAKIRTKRGTMKWAMRGLRKPMRSTGSSVWPSCERHGDENFVLAMLSLGTETAVASRMAGWAATSSSTSKQEMFSPRRRMASLKRSTKK